MHHHHRTTKKKPHPRPLPDEVITTILLKLSIKSLIRFTSLSKTFRTLILTTPQFTTAHFHHHHRHTPPKLLHIDFHFNCTIPHSIPINTSLHNDSSHHTLFFPLRNFSHPVPIRGSTRGIILLDDYTNLFLWNPTTGFLKRLSYPPLASTPTTFSVSVGFGYDELNDDYAVVVASACHPMFHPNPASRFEVFTTRTKSWSIIETDRLYYLRVGDQFSCFFNGSVHWLVQIEDGNWKDVITVFDLSERRLSNDIELPREFTNNWNSCRIRVLGGFLSVCFSNLHDEVEIWVMREYRVSSSWSKHVVVKDYGGPSHKLSPICFNDDGEVVAKDDGVGLVKLDGRGELVEVRAYCSMSTTALYVETLLSPPGFEEEDDDR